MRYEDIDKAMELKHDYIRLKRIIDAIEREDRSPMYVAIWNNSERMELPKATSEKLTLLIRQDLMNIKEKIEEL